MRVYSNSYSSRRKQLDRCDITKAQLERLIQAVFDTTGLNLVYYKDDCVCKHFLDIMFKHKIPSPDALVERIKSSDISKSDNYRVKQLRNDFFDAVVNLVPCRTTRFFRDFWAFDSVVQSISTPPCPNDIRILSAGCSSGEEPFSIALALFDENNLKENDFRLIAVELSSYLLNKAKMCEYSIINLDQIPTNYMNHIIISKDRSCFTFANEIIERIEFLQGDLIDTDKEFYSRDNYHIVLLRYVVVFLKPEYANIVLRKVSESLIKGGLLWMGVGEFIEHPSQYSLQLVDASIYKRV